MLDGLKTQLTLALLAVKTIVVDFIGVSADQISEVASALISLGLVIAASFFRHLGNRHEKFLKDALDRIEAAKKSKA